MRLSTSGGSLDLKDLKGDIRATNKRGGAHCHGSDIEGELIAHTIRVNIISQIFRAVLKRQPAGGNIDVSIKERGINHQDQQFSRKHRCYHLPIKGSILIFRQQDQNRSAQQFQ
jgi:hypothetical protein